MFKNKKIKYLKINKLKENLFGETGEFLIIKYQDENEEEFLTREKVDLKNWRKTQKKYFNSARQKVRRKAKGWQERHNNYLKYTNN